MSVKRRPMVGSDPTKQTVASLAARSHPRLFTSLEAHRPLDKQILNLDGDNTESIFAGYAPIIQFENSNSDKKNVTYTPLGLRILKATVKNTGIVYVS